MSTLPDFTFCLVCMILSLKFLCSIVLRSEILSGFFALIMYACVRGNLWWILYGVCLLVTRKHLMETLPSCCNIFLLRSESPLEATHWSGQHVLGHEVESITRACLISLSRCFSGFGDCHKSLSQGRYDNVVHIYQRSYILASVNGVEIYPRMLNMNWSVVDAALFVACVPLFIYLSSSYWRIWMRELMKWNDTFSDEASFVFFKTVVLSFCIFICIIHDSYLYLLLSSYILC